MYTTSDTPFYYSTSHYTSCEKTPIRRKTTGLLMAYWHRFLLVAASLLLLSVSAQAQKTGFGGTSFSQFANEPGKEQWLFGILNPNNSEYFEGTSTPQRLLLKDIPRVKSVTGDKHSLYFRVLATKAGINAYDFLVSYDQTKVDYEAITGSERPDLAPSPWGEATQGDATLMRTLYQTGFPASATAPAAAQHKPGSTGTSKTTGYIVSKYDVLYPNGRKIQLYSDAAFVGTPVLTLVSYTNPDKDADSYAQYRLDFEFAPGTSPASPDLLILMGGHLAISGNTGPANLSDLTYAIGKGASFISGGPYHFKLDMLDGISLGNQDNQIQSGAITIFVPASCTLPNNTSVCEGGVLDYSVSTAVSNATIAWSIVGDGEFVQQNADLSYSVVTPGNVTAVKVRAKSVNSASLFTVKATITAPGYTENSCEDEVIVNDSPGAAMSNSGPICAGSSANVTINFADGTGPWTFTYTINGGTGGTVTSTSTDPYIISTGALNANATYALTSLTNSSGCSASTLPSSEVVVNAVPSGTNVSMSSCPTTVGGSTAVFDLTSKNSAVGGTTDISVAWFTAYNATTKVFSGPISSSATPALDPAAFVASNNTTVYAKLSGTGGCIGVAQNVLTVNGTPAGTNTSMSSCPTEVGGTTAIFNLNSQNNTVTGGVSGVSVEGWYTGYSAGSFSGPISATDAAAYETGSKTVYAKLSGAGGCIGFAENVLTVNASPDAPEATIDQPSCSRTLGGITVTSPLDEEGKDYEYSYDKGASWTDEVTATFGAGQGYNIIYRIKGTGCISLANSCLSEEELKNPIVAPVSGSVQTKDASSQRSIRTEAYPNPTGRDATINFSVPRSGHVKVDVYNALGRYVTTLYDGEAKGGENNSVVLKGAQLPTGTYYYKVTTDGKTKTNRISLVK